jgi:SSS family solute:Na+ symporter
MNYFLFLASYLVILLGLGVVFTKKMRGLEDFFLASRGLSSTWIFLTLVASWIGATSILVSVDAAFADGISSFWVMGVPALMTVCVFFVFLARPIRKLPILTLPDLVELRYGRMVRHLASFLIIWYMILLASSQMVALGNFLQAFLHASYLTCLVIGTIVVLIYTVLGGFFSVVLTDGVQFFFLMGGIFGLLIFLLQSSSLHDVCAAVQVFDKVDYFSFFHDIKRNVLIALSFVLAWLVSPITWQRIQAARNVKSARQGLAATSITLFILYGIIVCIGLFSLPVLSGSQAGNSVLSALIAAKMGKVGGGFLFVAVVAAIMSTMDTAVNTGALSLTHDAYFQIFPRKKASLGLVIGRFSTLMVTLMAFLVATRFQSILKTLGLASEIMAAGFFVPGIAMVYLRKKRPLAGLLSLVLGGGFALVGFLCEIEILSFRWPDWPFSVPLGVFLSLIGFLIGMLIDNRMGTPH